MDGQAMTLDIHKAAGVVADIRTHTARHSGCREWDTPGIAAAIGATIGPPGAVLAAAALAAEDKTLDKPSAAAFKAHWPKNASEQPRPSHDIPCPDHPGRVMPCDLCREGRRPPTEDELAEIREAYQASVRAKREELAQIEQRKAAGA